ncbi:MAG TPA: hypothetical protein VNA21_08830 [Steroidobacteraceae bacterium]|nr:hypothetical protein [Steroidobacteraceae bacterium]
MIQIQLRRLSAPAQRAALALMIGLIATASLADASNACLLSTDELQTATSREFAPGEPTKAAGGSLLCAYAERSNPKRHLTIEMSSEKAKQQFESRVRLLSSGHASIALAGVGDAAYYNGTAAGVLVGDRLIAIGGLRRAPDPKIAPEKVARLLELAIKQAR